MAHGRVWSLIISGAALKIKLDKYLTGRKLFFSRPKNSW